MKFIGRFALVSSVIAALLVPATGASATTQVFDCHLSWNSTFVMGWCNMGLGGSRVTGYCWNGSWNERFYGPWVTAGHLSTFNCNTGDSGKVLNGAWNETF